MNAILFGCTETRKQWLILKYEFTNSTRSIIMELCEQLRMLKKCGWTTTEYILKAKTIYDLHAYVSKIDLKRELILYNLNGLGLCYMSSKTTFNMT